jgi:hypothetical protein
VGEDLERKTCLGDVVDNIYFAAEIKGANG